MVAAAFCFFYLTTNYVLGSLLLAGILEQFNVKDTEARRLQRRAIVRKLHNAEVFPAAAFWLTLWSLSVSMPHADVLCLATQPLRKLQVLDAVPAQLV